MSISGILLTGFGGGGGGSAGPTVPSFLVTDNGDDTGATASISDGDADATHTVWTKKIDSEFRDVGDWTESGSRTGNGSVALSALAAGQYWGYVEAIGPDLGETTTDPIFFAVTTGSDSVHYRCLTATQAKTIILGLSGIADSSIIVRKFPIDRLLGPDGIALPAIILTPARETSPVDGGTNNLDDIGYGVHVAIVAVDNQDLVANIDTYTRWREQICRAYRNKRLPGVAEVINCHVEPGETLSSEAWLNNLLASSFVLRFTSREPRD